jgi:hypothetical protein
VTWRPFAMQRPVNSKRGRVFPMRFLPRSYKEDSQLS